MDSTYRDILDEALAQVKLLALAGISDNVFLMKLPGVEEAIDVLPLVAIVPTEEPGEVKRVSFEGPKQVRYSFDTVFIVKGKRLLALTGNADPNDDYYPVAAWRQQVVDLFFDPMSLKTAVASVKTTRVVPGPPLDRTRLAQNYDYSKLQVQVFTME
jgi:hypothetical protein